MLARAQELKSARIARAPDLNEAAQQIKSGSQPVYRRLDELTKDQEMTFSDWQKAEKSAWRKGDFEAAQRAEHEQEKIFEQYRNEFSDPDAYHKARANWRQATALEKIHASLSTKAILQPTPLEFRPKDVPDPGVINGKNFSSQILKLRNDGTLQRAGLTKAHIQSLEDLGTLLQKSANVHKERLRRLAARFLRRWQ